MAKTKIKDSVWAILAQGLKLYFSNFKEFTKYMAFPVLGQVFGLILTFAGAYLYTENLPFLINNFAIFNNFSIIFATLILILLPGLIIFVKAFWDYLVAYGAICSMTENSLKSGRVYDFQAHTELINRRTFQYVLLWLLFGLFTAFAYFPLFWVIGLILFVYFILIFQVFTFEEDKSPIACFSRSLEIIKGNFWRTFALMLLLWLTTQLILPELIKFGFNLLDMLAFFASSFDLYTSQLPISDFNLWIKSTSINYEITSLTIARLMAEAFLGYIVIGFTLPIRSICFTLWYKNLARFEPTVDKKLLKRAMEKD